MAENTPENIIEPEMSDAAVRVKTGKDWGEWFAILDAAGALQMSHKEIVAFLVREYQVGSWWQQMLTVSYEKARGLRQKHEMIDGYQISRSKTIPAALGRLFAACLEEGERRTWLAEPGFTVRKATPGKTIRADWSGGHSRIEISFTGKGPDKTQVTVQHNKLTGAGQAEAMKAYWAEALVRLAQYVSGS
jgi:hypothetical protein